MTRDRWAKNRYIRYTALFCIATAAILCCFAATGKTMVYGVDGLHQHYPLVVRLRQAVSNLFTGRGFVMIDMTLGQGLDTVSTLAYYGLFDPLNLPALIGSTETAYAACILLRLYLTGLFFCAYLGEIGIRDDWAAPLAALMYALCGFEMRGAMEHPYFADGAIYLPLMLIGVERVFRQRKWLLLTLMTALMLVSNYYFAFKTTVLTILYIFIRLAYRLKPVGVKRSAGDGCTLLGAYLLGAALSAVILLPAGIGYLNNARIGADSASPLAYPAQYYANLVSFLCAPGVSCGYWNVEGFCPIALFGAAMLFMRGGDGKSRQIRAGLILTLIMLCVPLAGRLMNGMGYAVNRWCYGFGFVLCAAAAWAMPQMTENAKPLSTVGFAYALLAAVYAAVLRLDGMRREAVLTLFGAAAAVGFAVLLRCAAKLDPLRARRWLALAVTVCVAGFALINCPPFEKGFEDKGIAARIKNEMPALESEDFARVDAGISDDNLASMQGYSGTGFYWSVIPDDVSRYYRDLEAPGLIYAFRLNGLCADTALETLASVRYAVRNDDMVLPYGFVQTQQDVYENEAALPLGYAFHSAISEVDYASLDPAQKRLALLNCAVTDVDLQTIEPKFASERVEWSVAAAKDAELTDGLLTAASGGMVTLELEAVPDAEMYLRLTRPRLDGASAENYAEILVRSAAGSNRAYVTKDAGSFAYDQAGVFANLGCGDGLTECTLEFERAARITFDSLEIYAIPTECYRGAAVRSAERLREISLENDRLSGKIEMNAPGILQISLPVSDGWSAKVDGEAAEIVRCGGMYMGILLDAGEHEIEMDYRTPGLQTGAWISTAALLMILLLRIPWKKRVPA